MTEYITLLSLLNNYFSQAKILFHFDLLYHSKYSLSCILSNLFYTQGDHNFKGLQGLCSLVFSDVLMLKPKTFQTYVFYRSKILLEISVLCFSVEQACPQRLLQASHRLFLSVSSSLSGILPGRPHGDFQSCQWMTGSNPLKKKIHKAGQVHQHYGHSYVVFFKMLICLSVYWNRPAWMDLVYNSACHWGRVKTEVTWWQLCWSRSWRIKAYPPERRWGQWEKSAWSSECKQTVLWVNVRAPLRNSVNTTTNSAHLLWALECKCEHNLCDS